MKINEVGNELKRVLELDRIQYIKSDDIASYYEGNKDEQIISLKYVAGRTYSKIKGEWSLIKGIFINIK